MTTYRDAISLSSFILQSELEAEYPNAFIQVSDKDYQIMHLDSIQTWGWRMFNWLLTFFKVPRREDNPDLPKWKNKLQCEDVSLILLAVILLMHFRSKKSKAEGVAAGLIFHTNTKGIGHVVLTIRTYSGWTALEPQTNEKYYFTQKEKDSAWLVILF